MCIRDRAEHAARTSVIRASPTHGEGEGHTGLRRLYAAAWARMALSGLALGGAMRYSRNGQCGQVLIARQLMNEECSSEWPSEEIARYQDIDLKVEGIRPALPSRQRPGRSSGMLVQPALRSTPGDTGMQHSSITCGAGTLTKLEVAREMMSLTDLTQ